MGGFRRFEKHFWGPEKFTRKESRKVFGSFEKRIHGETLKRLLHISDVSVVITIAVVSVVARVLRPSVNQCGVNWLSAT